LVYSTGDDDNISGQLTGDFYVDAAFDGGVKGFCVPRRHASTTQWFATGTGSSQVSATLTDVATNPPTNDSDVTITLGQNPSSADSCNGFTVYAETSVHGPVTVEGWTINEGVTDYRQAGCGQRTSRRSRPSNITGGRNYERLHYNGSSG
jgi:hypothetical protein